MSKPRPCLSPGPSPGLGGAGGAAGWEPRRGPADLLGELGVPRPGPASSHPHQERMLITGTKRRPTLAGEPRGRAFSLRPRLPGPRFLPLSEERGAQPQDDNGHRRPTDTCCLANMRVKQS